MNLILLEHKDFIDDDIVRIKGRRFLHLKTVNRIREGDTLVCGRLNGNMGRGRVTRLSGRDCRLTVCLDTAPPDPLPLTLVLALPRPKMLRRIIQDVTTLGVKEIFLINSWRVEKSYWKSPVLAEDTLRQQMILGLEQGRDTLLPRIFFKRFFKDFVNQELSAVSKNTLKILAHPKAATICPHAVNKPVTLVVGPEGGFIDIEVASFEKTGFNSCQIGSRILKVETAVTVLISRLFA